MKTKARSILESLRPEIGASVQYEGKSYKMIELLEDDLAIVLEACHKNMEIQPDQMGEAHRRVPHTICIPVLIGEHKDEINPAVYELGLPVVSESL